ncbi:tyrosine-type recombinase/integrase [Marivivens sp. LCG002]|uniref:tyrosine-type recombinase/integrase n=1 Tax=Marivivens sp. LCG002 TaxID=3051171 RepID=UPI00255653D6|nr:tyrosine-type recombinase/integrase [Marivivens sp. LCG002]WIV50717.1 tyrosine-type recombinase/integrase [Marivivens sp. LCG002]
MSHIQYTLLRSNTYYYNRRVPRAARYIYGDFIRVALSTEQPQAEVLAGRLTDALNAAWSDTNHVMRLNIEAIISSHKPRLTKLSEFTSDYLSWKSITPTPVLLASRSLISLLGDRHVSEYSREDIKLFAQSLLQKGNRTGTVRRRLNCISAVLNYAYAELELDKRNPASRVLIRGEGADAMRRATFTSKQLELGYKEALASGSDVRLLFPLLGETGCRLAEITGLRIEDVCISSQVIHISPHSCRRLKTKGSERDLPLVGYALEAMELALKQADQSFLFPRYLKEDAIRATHASNALNRWVKQRFGGLTAHSLRHTMRDRLRAACTPLELIDQIGGWSSVNSIGSQYGEGYSLKMVRDYLEKVKIE